MSTGLIPEKARFVYMFKYCFDEYIMRLYANYIAQGGGTMVLVDFADWSAVESLMNATQTSTRICFIKGNSCTFKLTILQLYNIYFME